MIPDELNSHEIWEGWRDARRNVAPQESFVDDVMAAVDRTVPAWHPAATTLQRRLIPVQGLPWLLASAAAVVCTVRAYSVLRVLTEPTPDCTVVVDETKQEVPNDNRDVSRS